MWRWRSSRRGAGLTTLTFYNLRSTELRLWLEPWAEEFGVPVASRVDLILIGLREEPAEAPFEWHEDGRLTFFAPGGSRVRVLIDGIEHDSGSAEISVPASAALGTRGFIGTVFGDFPQMRPGGASPDSGLEREMVGSEVRLEPLEEAHRESLQAACAKDLEIWQVYATSYDPEHFDASFDLIRSRPNWRCFAIFFRDELVGMSCYIGIEPERGVLEIGNTYYVPEMRGTGFNQKVKDLMLERAFGCGFRRVEFRVDSRNARSQAAMAKLGAVREGMLRADRITWTGHVRDTVLFSILANEWPSR